MVRENMEVGTQYECASSFYLFPHTLSLLLTPVDIQLLSWALLVSSRDHTSPGDLNRIELESSQPGCTITEHMGVSPNVNASKGKIEDLQMYRVFADAYGYFKSLLIT